MYPVVPSFKINSSTWLYTAPVNYISKIDNFEKERKKGEKYLKNEEKEVTFSTDDVILLSLQKKDSSTNVIFVTYKNNFNIKNHTLNGYAQILKEILIRNGKNEYPNNESSVTVDEILIDKIKFNVIRQTIFFNNENDVLAAFLIMIVKLFKNSNFKLIKSLIPIQSLPVVLN